MLDMFGQLFPIYKETPMQQEFKVAENWIDVDGNPGGGTVLATGLEIIWQNGPLGRGDERKEPNGAFVETVIAAALQRIEHYQEAFDGKFACAENYMAIEKLKDALHWLDRRTRARELRGVEGTHDA